MLKLVAFAILQFASLSTFNVASANAADGTIIAAKGADRSASGAVSGAATYADPFGTARSHGCIRVNNSRIRYLARFMKGSAVRNRR